MYTFKQMQRELSQKDMLEYISETLISNIIFYRSKLKLSQKELAEKANITQSMISKMENDINTPSLQTLAKLLEAMNLDVKITVCERNSDNQLKKIDPLILDQKEVLALKKIINTL